MSDYSDVFSLLENKKVRAIVDAAKVEFDINGIINAKLRDIAKRAKVGEATLYRYFPDKSKLAELVTFDYWNDSETIFASSLKIEEGETISGLDAVKRFLSIFKELYLNHRAFLKNTEDFDNYVMALATTNYKLNFEANIDLIKDQFIYMIEKGKMDGSIKEEVQGDYIYEIVSQVLMSTSQKMAIRVSYLQSEQGVNPVRVLDNLVEMLINKIKNSEQA